MRLEATLRHRFPSGFELDLAFDVGFDPECPVAGLFGPSGCGKSSTLAALAGLLRVDGGRIALDGEVLLDRERGVEVQPHRRGVGWVPQRALLFPHLDVAANLSYAERRAQTNDRPVRDRVVQVLELGPLLERTPATLSGGEAQRVAIGRALLSGPRLLLLDEPVSALDARARFRVLAFLERVVGEFAVPALYVSHHRAEMQRLARHVVRMQDGRAVATGAPQDVLPAAPSDGPIWNLLRVVGAADPGGEGTEARCGTGRLVLPRRVAGGAEVWCRIASSAVAIALPAAGPGPSMSQRNRLAGRVVHLAADDTRVRVAVDAGIPLQVDLTPEAVAELALEPGSTVVCLFKAHAIEVL